MCFQYICEYGTLKPGKVILRRVRDARDNNGGEEPNQGIISLSIYLSMEMS
jgi:hypothetical protein